MGDAKKAALVGIGDEFLEGIAGGTMTEQDKQRFLEAMQATKGAGISLDCALDALEKNFGATHPDDLAEYREFMIQNW